MNLSEYFKETGMLQGEFALAVKCSQATISRIVHGKQNPESELAVRIVVKTKGRVTLNEMFGVPRKYWEKK